MIKFQKTYKLYNEDYSQIEKLTNTLKISSLTAKVLINRGFNTVEKARDFLHTDLDNLHDPFLLKDIDKAVDRIINAINKDEVICIYGDYDADGVTSTSLLSIIFNKLKLKYFHYIPNRLEEGYGLNIDAVDYIAKRKANLLITVDCGITSFDEVEYLNNKGIDVIITDHHQCKEKLPSALAVVNPNREDDEYPFNNLAGVGVAFKLIEALLMKLDIPINYEEILPIVALGTVADVMPLVGENRIIVKNGLLYMERSKNFGIKALLEVTNLKDKKLSAYHMGFVLGPRLNAAGRLGDPSIGVSLFTSDNYDEAIKLAEKLDEENKTRQDLEEEILKDIDELIEKTVDLDKDKVIVLASDKWHSGIIGICASKVTDKYFKPTILFSIEGDLARGSARSIPTFDIYDGLSKCSDMFEKFGGHRQAAGILIKTEKIDEFRESINNIAEEFLDEEDFIQEVVVDCEVEAKDVTIKTIKEINELEPFGIDNPSPKFIFTDGHIKNIRQIGKDNKHLKVQLNKDDKIIDGIGFSMGEYGNILNSGDLVDIIVNLDINEYMGNVNPQFIIKEITSAKYSDPILGRDYYYALKKFLNSTDMKCSSKNIECSFSNIENRLSYTVDRLNKSKGLLVLVFNYLNANTLISNATLQGREFLRKTSFSYNCCDNNKENNVVILPLMSEIDVSSYDEIIFYDLSYDESFMGILMDKKDNANIEFLFNKNDIELNKKVLSNLLPTKNEMRLIYKTIFSNKFEVLKIEPDMYLNSINNKLDKYITKPKLDLTFEMFKELKLIDYIYQDDYFYIKILNRSNEKIDILNNSKLRYLYDLNKY
ncbi:single-stranded-DNA-specific exonuclease RecJ [Anaerosalibacter sp. Marseille-P3206]|uniref:single-stranded-DNA-specific exonuclease RecJ n=1 Tax=Anaerosalibacter sp. Marseille-P3206 TaxID=1871005 RepID=UPI0009874C12|nr:single-stranded-DNA-specific exonuclease RecJ [Anaerosalibacter sp. Marseille-P3206]